MFLNYLKVGLRNILKHKAFSFINMFGLAAAMSICMLIILMLADQKQYDQFNTRKDRIYRILCGRTDWSSPYATSPVPLAGSLKADDPAIEATTHLVMGVGGDATYNRMIVQMRGFFADTSFFRVFSYELENGGDRNTALSAPNSMVITSELARQLFNSDNPVGKTVEFTDRGLNYLESGNEKPPTRWGSYTITGVIADKNYKSHLKFDVLVSSSSMHTLYEDKRITELTNNWEDYYSCFTYVLLDPQKTGKDLDQFLSSFASRKYAGNKDFKGFNFIGQKLTTITPGILVGNATSYSMPMVAYYFMSFLAFVIMLSACLNYTNLSVARALTRAKEIGVRKVAGADRKDLIFQFLSESIITAMLALVMGIILLFFIKSAFMHLWVNKYLNFDLKGNVIVYFVFAGLALLIGIIAGVYPALYLSKFQPIKVLKNNDSMRPGKMGMRKILSVSQFVISLFFIITSILIFDQFRHFLKFKYEFNPGNIVNVELQSNDYRIVSNELRSVPGVTAVSACDYLPATGKSNGLGLKKVGSKDEYKNLMLLKTDDNFLGNLQLKLIAGRNLPAPGEMSARSVVVNNATVTEMGYNSPSQIIGQTFDVKGVKDPVEVVGVVEDFHVRLLMQDDKIGPLVLQSQPEDFKYLNVKVASGDTKNTIAGMEEKWKTLDPIHPFKYQFYDKQLATTQQGLFDVVSILGFIAFLAITIACLGLLGMATYATERRMKEVGIRKVLGAGNFKIALLLSREFLGILLIAILIAAPVSFIINNSWLRKFPNRVEFGPGIILLGILLLLVLGLITIGSQTLRASKSNPVDTLQMN